MIRIMLVFFLSVLCIPCFGDQSLNLVRIMCPKGANFVDIGSISTPEMAGKSFKKLNENSYYHKNYGALKSIDKQCEIAGESVIVEVDFNAAHLGRCGGNSGSGLSIQIGGINLIKDQPLANTCVGPGLRNILINEYEISFCIVGVRNKGDSYCNTYWLSDIKKGKKMLDVRELIENLHITKHSNGASR